MIEPATAYVALGSNLGERRAILESAIATLDRRLDVEVTAVSSIFETEPEGQPGQGPYLNAAIVLRTPRSPRLLLELCLLVEAWHGRRRDDRGDAARGWAVRTLDLDLLLYDDEVIGEAGLIVPHPRLHERSFVLEPLAEVAGHVIHPLLGRSIECLRDDLREREREVDGGG